MTDTKKTAPKADPKLKIAKETLEQVESALVDLMDNQTGLGSIVANWEFSRVRSAGKDKSRAVISRALVAVRATLGKL